MRSLKNTIYNFFIKEHKNLNKNSYITCEGRNDGLGAQIQSILSVLLVAKQYNLTYVHTPIKELDHNNGKENFFEDFFDIGKDELIFEKIQNKKLLIKQIEHPLEIRNINNILYKTQSLHQYADKFPDEYLTVVKRFKDKFYYKFKEGYINYNDQKCINIAIHIRRGDVSINKNEVRFTDNTYYMSLIEKIFEISKKLQIDFKIHIYSQGVKEDFKEFNKYNPIYHLDECLITTFYNLIESDILVMSKSSLSFCAGLFNDNIVFYQPFWHKPLSDWNQVKIVNKIVSFDENEFLKNINIYLKQRENFKGDK